MAIKQVCRNDSNFHNWEAIDLVRRGTDFFEDGDDFLVYHNDENNMYAVYYKLWNNGELIALIDHQGDECDFNCMHSHSWTPDDAFSMKLYDLFQEHAMEYGFPEKHPPLGPDGMTWREIRDAINEMPEHMLDVPARVWLPGDIEYRESDMFPTFTSISAYYENKTPDWDNEYSFNLNEETV